MSITTISFTTPFTTYLWSEEFLGLKDYAEKLMNGLKTIMKFIEPFSDLISPLGVVEIIAGSVGGIKEVMDITSSLSSETIEQLTGVIFNEDGLLNAIGLFSLDEKMDFALLQPLLNFLYSYLQNDGDTFLNIVYNLLKELIEKNQPKTKTMSTSERNELIGKITGILLFGMATHSLMIKFIKWETTKVLKTPLNEKAEAKFSLILTCISFVFAIVTTLVNDPFYEVSIPFFSPLPLFIFSFAWASGSWICSILISLITQTPFTPFEWFVSIGLFVIDLFEVLILFAQWLKKDREVTQ